MQQIRRVPKRIIANAGTFPSKDGWIDREEALSLQKQYEPKRDQSNTDCAKVDFAENSHQ